ncbi:MAG: hypothetical protein JWM57_2563 [Phycisphaerales bacterium]|nr:hypothetical protein [Phycisphaerales bacterium]
MALSKSWSSDATAVTRKKYFTIAEANRALPLVRRIVEDLVRTHEDASTLHNQLEHRLPVKQRDEIQNALERAVDRLGDLIDELKSIGCDLKDYRTGLIDFVGRHDGRDIFLCWKLGEASIEYWHEIHTGFSGRQPVSELVSE